MLPKMLMLVVSAGMATAMSRPKVTWPLSPTPTMFPVADPLLINSGVLLMPSAPATPGRTSVPTRRPPKVDPVEGSVPEAVRVVVPV